MDIQPVIFLGMDIFDLVSFYIPHVSHFHAFWYLTLRDEFMIPFKNTCEFLSYQNGIEISKIAPEVLIIVTENASI